MFQISQGDQFNGISYTCEEMQLNCPGKHCLQSKHVIERFGLMLNGSCEKARSCVVCNHTVTAYYPIVNQDQAAIRTNAERKPFNSNFTTNKNNDDDDDLSLAIAISLMDI